MQSEILFPLTLALSLGERERIPAGGDQSLTGERFPVLPTVHPLPEGEGLEFGHFLLDSGLRMS
jgi:hypothetical protein